MNKYIKRGFSLAELGIAMVILLIVATIATISYFTIIDNAKEVKVVEESKTIRLSLARQGIDIKDYSTPVVFDDLEPKVKDVLEYHLSNGTNLIGTVFQNKAILKDGEYIIGELRAKSSDLDSTVLLDLLNIQKVKASEVLDEICVRQLDSNEMNKLFTEEFSGDWFIIESLGNCITLDEENEGNNKEVINRFIKEVEKVSKVPEGYVGVYTVEHLNDIRNNMTGKYILMNDLDLSTYGLWEPIGDSADGSFKGLFNGNGYTISNLSIDNSSYSGLFGYISSVATISNLGLENVNIKSVDKYAGSLVGYSYGTVYNTYATGTIEGDGSYIGGLVGRNEKGSVDMSSFNGDVLGIGSFKGLLVGANYNGTISNSYSEGTIKIGQYIGGLTGYNYDNSKIINSYSIANVFETKNYAGGLVGYNRKSKILNSYTSSYIDESNIGIKGGLVGYGVYTDITNSYSISDVINNTSNTGGLIGSSGLSSPIINSYWDSEISNLLTTRGEGGLGKLTEEMKQVETYVNWDKELLEDGLTSVWVLKEGEYPKLWFEE